MAGTVPMIIVEDVSKIGVLDETLSWMGTQRTGRQWKGWT